MDEISKTPELDDWIIVLAPGFYKMDHYAVTDPEEASPTAPRASSIMCRGFASSLDASPRSCRSSSSTRAFGT